MGIDLEQPTREFHTDDNGCNVNITMANDRDDDFHGKRTVTSSPSIPGISKENTGGNFLNGGVGDGISMSALKSMEPHDAMEFESKEEAFSYYKEYAKSVGFDTIIKASRRSRVSGSFIDAKFVCTRYGSKRESATAVTQDSALNTDGTSGTHVKKKRGRTSSSLSKTDCKACMHVKRRQDGRWIIRNFTREHNHEIFPYQAYYLHGNNNLDFGSNNIDRAIRGRTKNMHFAMFGQRARHKKLVNKKGCNSNQSTSEKHLALDEGDVQFLLDNFMHMQDENPHFFYAIDLNGEQKLKNTFWVDAKGRLDYASFSDVVFLDTTYIKNEYKLPLALFIGINHHFQLLLLGCALVADNTEITYVWLMRAWLRAMGGHAPKVILTDQDKALKDSVAKVFPNSRHCFCLWHILSKIPEKLNYVLRQRDNFMTKFNKCIFISRTPEQFENRWWKMVDRFNLRSDMWFQSLFEDHEQWVPTFMKDIFLAGMSTSQRSESICSHFDKHVQRKTTIKEFLEQYKSILQQRHEEEAKADFEMWHKQPGLKSPSPFGKQMAAVYTHTIFKKFQVEVLGVVACHPRKERVDGVVKIYKVQDFEKNQDFVVMWDEKTSNMSCLCHSFEYNGFLCRHVLIVLQMSGVHNIPSLYILKRWTKDAKSRQRMGEAPSSIDSQIRRYNDICQWGFELGDVGSLSQESYNIALNSLEEALKKCESASNSVQDVTEPNLPLSDGFTNCQASNEENDTPKEKRMNSILNERKVNSDPDVVASGMHDSWQQMEQLNSRALNLTGCFLTQQIVEGMEQFNSVPHNDAEYYGRQDSMQGLGQPCSNASVQDGNYINQQRVHEMGQIHFKAQNMSNCFELEDGLQDMELPSARPSQLHPLAPKHFRTEHITL